jgi:hypothetical protein
LRKREGGSGGGGGARRATGARRAWHRRRPQPLSRHRVKRAKEASNHGLLGAGACGRWGSGEGEAYQVRRRPSVTPRRSLALRSSRAIPNPWNLRALSCGLSRLGPRPRGQLQLTPRARCFVLGPNTQGAEVERRCSLVVESRHRYLCHLPQQLARAVDRVPGIARHHRRLGPRRA